MNRRSSPASPVPLVLHVIPTAIARGAQREARALADHLDLPGVRHHRLLSLFAGPRHVRVDEALEYQSAHPATGLELRLVMRLRRRIRQLRPAAVIAHGGDSLKYLVPAIVGRRLPLVYYVIGTFAHPESRTRTALWRTLVRRADLVAAEGEEVLTECRSLWRVSDGKSVLAPNGRDPQEFRPAAPATGAETRSLPVLAFVGALAPSKRPGRFIEVVAELRRRGVRLDAVACGDGPLAGALVEPAREAGVELLGAREDVDVVLRESDVLLFPSLPTGEGMPGVLIEAGLSGIPVVATAVPGAASIVDDGTTGLVVDPDDFGAMVDATQRLVADAALRRRMGADARRHCTNHFSIEAVVARWSSFIEPLVDGRLTRWNA